MSLKKIDPAQTSRKVAFEKFQHQGMPMLSLTKTFDVSNIIRLSKKTKHKFNIIINYLIAKAGSQIENFYFKIDAFKNELYKGDKIIIDFVTKRKDENIAFCELVFNNDFNKFEKDYLTTQKYCYENNCDYYVTEKEKVGGIIGTSTVPWTDLDCVVNQYVLDFPNPFLVIMKYQKKFFKYSLKISFHFHHLQMDGEHVCKFLELLQQEIKNFKIK